MNNRREQALQTSKPSFPVQYESTVVSDSANGCIRHLKLHSGITLSTMDCDLDAPLVISFCSPSEAIGIGFSLSGMAESKVDGKVSDFSFSPGCSNVTRFPDFAEVEQAFSRGPSKRICLVAPLESLQLYAEHHRYPLPCLFKKHACSGLHQNYSITSAMRLAAAQIISSPYEGMTGAFFIESKVLELLALKFEQLALIHHQCRKSCPGQGALSARDTEGVHHAASLLTQNVEEPLSLEEVAREVGMCRSKLHESFRAVYGVTPFEYQRDYRLEAAKRYLLEGRMNITEIAFAVGYSSSGYFTKAFKKRFGKLPKKYLKEQMA